MVILLVVVAVLGAAAGFLRPSTEQEMARDAKTADLNEAKAQIEADRQEISELSTAVTQYRTQAEGLAQQLTYLKSQLAQAQRAEQERVERERERAAAEAERKQAENERKLQEQSKVLSALAPVQKNLDALRQKVSQIEEGRKREMGALGEQLKGLGEQQARLDRETNALSSALRNNKVRGAWGEAQLRNIVESAGLLEHVDFDTQVVVTDVDGRTQRPDMIIHMPGGKPFIDAKSRMPTTRACEIPDTATPEELTRKSELLHAHAKAVREHVKTLGDKAYWNAFADAPDFVIAFHPQRIPAAAALETDPTLMDDAFARKVALTSPITLWAVLKSVAYAWQQQSLTDDAKMLFDLSRELYERFAVLGDRATKLGSAITKTVGAYNAFASSLESRVLVTARKLQRVDQSRIIEPVNMIAPEKADVRELTAPETSEQ
mgnify:CR=1 FL=1